MHRILWKHFWKSFLLTVALLVVICLIVFFTVFHIGHFLAISDTPQSVDVIVVLSGGGNERMQKAVDLYHAGWSDTIIVSGASLEASLSNADTMFAYGQSHGVPDSAIIKEPYARTTWENAQRVQDILPQDVESLILVTTGYHQRRASYIFDKTFPNIEIYNLPAEVEFWEPEEWWSNRKSIRLTLTECAKIFIGRLFGYWG